MEGTARARAWQEERERAGRAGLRLGVMVAHVGPSPCGRAWRSSPPPPARVVRDLLAMRAPSCLGSCQGRGRAGIGT